MRLLLVNLSGPNMNRRYTKQSEYKYGISLFTVEQNKIKKNHRNSLKLEEMKADNLYIAKEIGIGWTNLDFFGPLKLTNNNLIPLSCLHMSKIKH
jgi:hypothetical protein